MSTMLFHFLLVVTVHPDLTLTGTLTSIPTADQNAAFPQEFPTCNFTFITTSIAVQKTAPTHEPTSTHYTPTQDTSTPTSAHYTHTQDASTPTSTHHTPTQDASTPTSTHSAPTQDTSTPKPSSTTGKSTGRPATSTTSSYFTLTSSYSSTANVTCKRKCPCRNTTKIVRNLTVNKAETSKTRRELTCAGDSRQSAQVVGALGIAILSVVFAGIIILDLPRLMSLF